MCFVHTTDFIVCIEKRRGDIKMYKKFLAIGLSLAMACGMVACDDSDSKKAEGIDTEYGVVKLNDWKEKLVAYEDDMKTYVDNVYAQAESYMIQYGTTTEEVKEGTVKKDSVVTVDYEGKIEVKGEKKAFEGGTAQDQKINVATNASADGSTNYIEGFSADFAGHKVGDTFTTKVTFPDGYQDSKVDGKTVKMSGRDAWFTITIKSITKTNTPKKVTDKLVKKTGAMMGFPSDVTTVKKLKDYIEEQYSEEYKFNYAFGKIIEAAEVTSYDKDAKESQFESQKKQIESQYASYGITSFDQYLEVVTMSEEEWKKDKATVEAVESGLKSLMVLEAVAKELGVEVSDSVYKKEVESLGEMYSMSANEVESQYGKETINQYVLMNQVKKALSEKIKMEKGSEPTTAAPETTTEETTEAKKEDK